MVLLHADYPGNTESRAEYGPRKYFWRWRLESHRGLYAQTPLPTTYWALLPQSRHVCSQSPHDDELHPVVVSHLPTKDRGLFVII
jgi:hypothetical protein